MKIYKDKGLVYSEYIIDRVMDRLISDDKVYAKVETFYNCRELGYVLEVHTNNPKTKKDFDRNLCIWIYGHRNSDEPTITWEETTLPQGIANMFTDDGYYNHRKTFEHVDDAAEYVINLIKDYFEL